MQQENQQVSEYDQEMPQLHTTDQPMAHYQKDQKNTSDTEFRTHQSIKLSLPDETKTS